MNSSPFVAGQLVCPKCDGHMPRVPGIAADAWRCEICNGLWLAMGAERILRDDAEDIDIEEAAPVPPAAAGAHGRDLHCPACGKYELLDMVDAEQPHIHFESCKFCYGRFYDAGEFRDASEETVMEYLRTVLATVRVNLASKD